METLHLAASRVLDARGQAVAESMVDCYQSKLQTYGIPPQTRDTAAALRHVFGHLQCLSAGLRFKAPALFVEHMKWFYSVVRARGEAVQAFQDRLECYKKALGKALPEEAAQLAIRVVEECHQALEEKEVDDPPSELPRQATYGRYARPFLEALLKGDSAEAIQLVERAAGEGMALEKICLRVIQPALYEVGRRWQLNHVHAAKGHVAAAVAQRILMQLNDRVFSAERTGHACVVACAGDEMHEVGARMVADFFEMSGWDAYYMGTNLSVDRIIERCRQLTASVLCVSVTMVHNLVACAELIRRVRKDQQLQAVNVLVGGQVFGLAPDLWRRVGADGYGADALDGVTQARELLERK